MSTLHCYTAVEVDAFLTQVILHSRSKLEKFKELKGFMDALEREFNLLQSVVSSPAYDDLSYDAIMLVADYYDSLSDYRSKVRGVYDEYAGRYGFTGLTHYEILRSLSESRCCSRITTGC